MRDRLPPDWPGRIAFVLSLAVAISLVGGVLIAEIKPGAVSDAEINFFSVLGGGAIAEIATYIALRSKGRHEEEIAEEREDNREEVKDDHRDETGEQIPNQ